MRALLGGCKICTAMCGNGVWTFGTILIGGHRRMAVPGRQLEEHPGCCAAGRGAAAPGTAARPTAATTSRAAAAASSVSASVASPRTNSLALNPLHLYPLAVGVAGASFFPPASLRPRPPLLIALSRTQPPNTPPQRCSSLARSPRRPLVAPGMQPCFLV